MTKLIPRDDAIARLNQRLETAHNAVPAQVKVLAMRDAGYDTPTDPRDAVIARLVEALEAMRCAFIPFSDDEFRAVYATDAALAAAKAVQHG
jgi:hypothetical protein